MTVWATRADQVDLRGPNPHDLARSLGKAFAPFLLFDPSERFFPVAAEEVLDHESTEPWPDATTHERGTAVLNVARAATVFSDADVVACLLYTSPSPRDRTRSR